ncbi:FecCD family ABC transporter permease [Thalassospira mesophila]|uniref:Heme ABC transporter n=1 Tax=Thalassospira mesophila TaxID=1293891 RepID=A0A1Y2KVJ3_9PROT|nr:iron ABC transporter permease [Thalassospira mesophila]OSQ35864.1 heme ABC transporter [Thalassospira mesophila]
MSVSVTSASRSAWPFPVLLLALVAFTGICACLYLMLGPRTINFATILNAITSYDSGNFDHRVLVDIRLPRLLAAIIAGANLGLSGMLLQGLLRNPLAEPHILGLNAGASLAVVLTLALPTASLAALAPLRPFTAALGGFVVFSITVLFSSAGRGGLTLLKVTFCGIAFSALASSLTTAILLLDEETLQKIRLWLVGDLAGVTLHMLYASLAPSALALVLAVFIAPRLNVLELGDAVATGLGISIRQIRFLTILAAALCAGSAVSLVGPIGFVGLIVPNLVRYQNGNDYRQAVPLTLISGATLLILADLVARMVLLPHEIPTGIATALIGVPVFIMMVLRTSR